MLSGHSVTNRFLVRSMNRLSKVTAISVAMLLLISPVMVQSNPHSHPLNEHAALDLLQRTIKRDRVYEKNLTGLHRVRHRRDDEDLF